MFKKYSNIAQYNNAYLRLCNDFDEGQLYHAYILSSVDKLSTQIIARRFAGYALGNDSNDVNLSLQDKNADVHILPIHEQNRLKKTILTPDIDEMVSNLYVKPSKGEKKFYILDYGEAMNDSCQNKLLKTLEEPPKSVVIIILCSSLSLLLPTVLSRCKVIDVGAYTNELLINELNKIYTDSSLVDLAVYSSFGLLDSADKLLNDKAYKNMHTDVLSALLELNSSKDALAVVSKILRHKDLLEQIIDFMLSLYRDIIFVNLGLEKLVINKDKLDFLQKTRQLYTVLACEKIIEQLLYSKKRLLSYSNSTSIVDELVFAIVENRYKYKVRTD